MRANITLPPVLAGPILRRAEPSAFTVWFATSEPLTDLEVDVWVTRPRRPALAVAVELESVEVQFGERLYVSLHRVQPVKAEFPIRTRLKYRARAKLAGRQTDLTKGLDLGYAENGTPASPSILIAGNGLKRDAEVNPDRVVAPQLLGSCRKLHGPGHDAAIALRQLLLSRAQRGLPPHGSLILGGDQIYADDVSTILIEHIGELAVSLMGFREHVAGIGTLNTLPPDGRGELVKEKAGFSSGEAKNHALSFGEYAALHLLAWNPEVWPSRLPDARQVAARAAGKPKLDRLRKERRALLKGWRGTRAIRTVLANVPSYMMFDDHEITDDWNLNPRWERRVARSESGLHVIGNGLAAFWAFQGWGNDPTAEPIEFTARVAEAIVTTSSSKVGASSASANPMFRKLRNRRWSYVAPTQPRTLMVDTRTRRGPSSRGIAVVPPGTALDSLSSVLPRSIRPAAKAAVRLRTNRNAGLLVTQKEWSALSTVLRNSGHRRRDELRIAVPSPVVGVEGIEATVGFAAQLTQSTSEIFDYENWTANLDSYIGFMKFATEVSTAGCTVLSGDVHYSFNATSVVDSSPGSVGGVLPAAIRQLCSSAMKNKPEGWLEMAAKVLSSSLLTQGRDPDDAIALAIWRLGRHHVAMNLELEAAERVLFALPASLKPELLVATVFEGGSKPIAQTKNAFAELVDRQRRVLIAAGDGYAVDHARSTRR